MARVRNYKKEYEQYHSKPEQVKRRAARNSARADMAKSGRVKKGDGKDVDHKDYNPLNNSKKNLRVMSSSTNKSRQPKIK
mgnify:CR=1 FL=1